ncbi:MAG: flagellar biosynthetic protein FliR [bacterium]
MIISSIQLTAGLLILARIAGVFIQAPLFSSRSFPMQAKTAFAIWLAALLWFVTPISPGLPTDFFSFVIALTFEVIIGYLIGFVCYIIFIALQSGGEIIDLQMGLSVASALDPVFGAVISVIGRLIFFVTLLIFITLDGHHLLLSAFHQSFTLIPAGKIPNLMSYDLFNQLMGLGTMLWLTAIKIAAPIILLIFLADFTFGIVSRVAPQVNVFMLGFQIKPILGLFAISLLSPFLLRYVEKLIEVMGSEVLKLLTIIK